jgi:hypothetical protein
MNTENFEERLRNQPLRQIPAKWRSEILTAAQAAALSRRLSPVARPAPWWRELLWPSPTAWAGLACAWLVVLTLNAAARPTAGEQRMAGQTRQPSQEIAVTLAQRRQELAQLLSQSSETAIEPRRAVRPGPRSERNLATMET